MKCNKDCLNCQLKECIHDTEDRETFVNDLIKRKRHKYYLDNKTEIDAKQKVYDEAHKSRGHKYWEKNKKRLKEKNRKNYLKNQEKYRQQARERYELNKDEINRKRRERYKQRKENSA